MSSITPAGRIPYTENVWNRFKQRLADELRNKALSTTDIANDSEAKEFIINYADQELLNSQKEVVRLTQNQNIRLSHLSINTSNGPIEYPIILSYTGHHLTKALYFYKKDESITIGVVEVNPSGIILV